MDSGGDEVSCHQELVDVPEEGRPGSLVCEICAGRRCVSALEGGEGAWPGLSGDRKRLVVENCGRAGERRGVGGVGERRVGCCESKAWGGGDKDEDEVL